MSLQPEPEPEPEPEPPELTKAQRRQRTLREKAEAKAAARAKKEHEALVRTYEKQQKEQRRQEEKRRRADPAAAAAAEAQEAEEEWACFREQRGLVVRVEQARDLRESDSGLFRRKSAADPYVILRCSGEEHRTEALKNTQTPAWRDFFRFSDAEKTSRVDMELWDRDTFGRDNPLGLVGLHVKQVLELQKTSTEDQLDIWLHLQPLGRCTNPSGAVRIIARMNTRADRKSSGSGEFKSRKDQAESMAAERSANAEIEMAAALETMKTERALAAEAAKEAERMASVSAKEEAEAREAAAAAAEERQQAEEAERKAAKEEAELALAQELTAKELGDLKVATERVNQLQASVQEAQANGDDAKTEELVRALEDAKGVERKERAEYEQAEERRRAEQSQANEARVAAEKEKAEARVATAKAEAERAEADAASSAAAAAAAAAASAIAKGGASVSTGEKTPAREDGGAEQNASETFASGTAGGRPRRPASPEEMIGGKFETFFSRAARRNEAQAAQGTAWEKTKTSDGRNATRQMRAQLARSYCATMLQPSRAAKAPSGKKTKMGGRGARSRNYRRRIAQVAARYPTLAEPLEPGLAAWGARAPPPRFEDTIRIAGTLCKLRPTLLKEGDPSPEMAWRTRYVQLKVVEARPEIIYSRKAGGRELGRLDIGGYGDTQLSWKYGTDTTARPLTVDDLSPRTDEAAARMMASLAGLGPRSELLRDAAIACLEGNDSFSEGESASATFEAAAAAAAMAASSRPSITLTRKVSDRIHIAAPRGILESAVSDLRHAVRGSSRLDALAALLECDGCVVSARALMQCPVTPEKSRLTYSVWQLLKSAVVVGADVVCLGADPSLSEAAAKRHLERWYEALRYTLRETWHGERMAMFDEDAEFREKQVSKYGSREGYSSSVLSVVDSKIADGAEEVPPPKQRQVDTATQPLKGHPSFYDVPPASLYSVRGKLRNQLELASRWAPFESGLYRRQQEEFETSCAESAATEWKTGGKADNGGERWVPALAERQAVVMKAFAPRGGESGKSIGEVAAG